MQQFNDLALYGTEFHESCLHVPVFFIENLRKQSIYDFDIKTKIDEVRPFFNPVDHCGFHYIIVREI